MMHNTSHRFAKCEHQRQNGYIHILHKFDHYECDPSPELSAPQKYSATHESHFERHLPANKAAKVHLLLIPDGVEPINKFPAWSPFANFQSFRRFQTMLNVASFFQIIILSAGNPN
jgi:hypothetical protein